MTATRAFLSVFAFVVVIAFVAAPSAGASEPTSSQPTNDAAEQARAAFRRGVQLYEDRDFGAAGVEFRRAYQLAKNFRLLYNLGRVAVEEHDYASAVDLFNRYLADAADQIPSDRVKEVRDELSNLGQRVARIDVDFDDAGAAVFVDDVEKGNTPLLSPIVVNVGRRRVEVRPRTGAPVARWVDAPGRETVKVRLRTTLSPLDFDLSDSIAARPRTSARAIDSGSDRHRVLGLSWTATAACAVGATVAGVIAYRASRDLAAMRQTYPVTKANLDDKQRSATMAGAVSDGLSVATLAFGALSLYLTFGHSQSRTSVALAWPGAVVVDGHF
jgi:hypothetical protein